MPKWLVTQTAITKAKAKRNGRRMSQRRSMEENYTAATACCPNLNSRTNGCSLTAQPSSDTATDAPKTLYKPPESENRPGSRRNGLGSIFAPFRLSLSRRHDWPLPRWGQYLPPETQSPSTVTVPDGNPCQKTRRKRQQLLTGRRKILAAARYFPSAAFFRRIHVRGAAAVTRISPFAYSPPALSRFRLERQLQASAITYPSDEPHIQIVREAWEHGSVLNGGLNGEDCWCSKSEEGSGMAQAY